MTTPGSETPGAVAEKPIDAPWKELAYLVERGDAAGIVQLLDGMGAEDQRRAFSRLGASAQAEAISLVGPEVAADVVESLPDEQAADILEDLEPAVAADIVEELPAEVSTDRTQRWRLARSSPPVPICAASSWCSTSRPA
ncbi:MAG: hypothetical protein AAGC55_31450 [Myxococcota bacterium]